MLVWFTESEQPAIDAQRAHVLFATCGGVNRFFRRMQRFGKSFSARRSQGQMTNKQAEVFDAEHAPGRDERAWKSQRHRKSTADKWNQYRNGRAVVSSPND